MRAEVRDRIIEMLASKDSEMANLGVELFGANLKHYAQYYELKRRVLKLGMGFKISANRDQWNRVHEMAKKVDKERQLKKLKK